MECNNHAEWDDSDTEDDEVGAPKAELPPLCSCREGRVPYDESAEGPYYSQLGVGSSIESLRRLLEARTGFSGGSIRMEKLTWSGKEGRSKEGCPAAKYILRRGSPSEQILCLARHRTGHSCSWSWQIVAIVYWDSISPTAADELYNFIRGHLPTQGIMTERRCGTNESRTCACQGFNESQQGAAYSFGCSWSMYHNACKFARGSRTLGVANNSRSPRKFRLRGHKRGGEERELEHRINVLADRVGSLCSRLVPDAFARQVRRDSVASDCRLGTGTDIARPFAGVTACLDYCSHNHRENHNMEGSVTAVVSLLGRSRQQNHRNASAAFGSSSHEEQLHVLPMYHVDHSDAFGPRPGQAVKEQNNSVQCLSSFGRLVRQRAYPLPSGHARRRQARAAKSAASIGDAKSQATTPSTCLINSPKPEAMVAAQNSPLTETSKPRPTPHRCTIRLPSIDSWFRKPLYNLPPAGCWCNDPGLSDKRNNAGGKRDVSDEPKLLKPTDLKSQQVMKSQQLTTHESGPEATDREFWSQTEELFLNSDMGGVGIALTHGSVLLEVAKREVHATTALRQPNRHLPTRIGLIFYQHRNLHLAEHGRLEWRHRMDRKRAKKSLNSRRTSQKHCIIEDDEELEDDCEDAMSKDGDKLFKFQQTFSQPTPPNRPSSNNQETLSISKRYLATLEQYDSCIRE